MFPFPLLPPKDTTIEFVGWYFSASGGAVSSKTVSFSGNLTGGIDTSPRAGDLVVAIAAATTAGDTALGVSTSGYTSISELYYNNGADANLEASWKIMGDTPDTTVDITCSPAENLVGAVAVWRFVDSATPLGGVTPTTAASITGRPNPAAITPTTPGSTVAVVAMCAGNGSSTAMTSPDLENFQEDGGTFTRIAVGEIARWASGAVNPGAFTAGSTDVNDSYAAITFVIKPQ